MALPNAATAVTSWGEEMKSLSKWWGKKPSSASMRSPQAKGLFKFMHLKYMNHFKVAFLHFHTGQVSDLLLTDFPQGPTLLTSSQTRSRRGCLAAEGTAGNWSRPAPLPSAPCSRAVAAWRGADDQEYSMRKGWRSHTPDQAWAPRL